MVKRPKDFAILEKQTNDLIDSFERSGLGKALEKYPGPEIESTGAILEIPRYRNGRWY